MGLDNTSRSWARESATKNRHSSSLASSSLLSGTNPAGSLTIELRRRFANRFQFGASYVLSRALTYGGVSQDFGVFSMGVCPGCASPQRYTSQSPFHPAVQYDSLSSVLSPNDARFNRK